MLLDGEGLLGRTRLIASDIAPGALEKARKAYYREWSLRGLDPQIAARWLQSEHGQTSVCERIRRSVRFLQLNLAEASYPSAQSGLGSLDLIFCRNVMQVLLSDVVMPNMNGVELVNELRSKRPRCASC
jgi:chemotaxis protein methyltransferase CheR